MKGNLNHPDPVKYLASMQRTQKDFHGNNRPVAPPYQDTNAWKGFTPTGELHNPRTTERVQPDALFRTPVNTFTNLFFVLMGFYALALGIDDRRRARSLSEGYLAATPAMSYLFGGVRLQERWGLLALGLFYLGLYVRELDYEGRFSSRDSLFQGHSLWHLLAALFLAGTYLYYRSEQR